VTQETERLRDLRCALESLDDEYDEIVTARARWVDNNPGKYLGPTGWRSNWALLFPDENDRLAAIAEGREQLLAEIAEIETGRHV
jgi:hypothetical protein